MATLKAEQKKQRVERLSSVREFVFGVQDGVLTTAGVLFGLSGAVSGRLEVILAALASTAAGAMSMGAGAYLGTRAESEVIRGELDRMRRATQSEPYVIQEELLGSLAAEGLSRETSYRVVKLLSSSPKLLLATVEEKVYGLGGAMLGNPAADGLVMGAAFLVGALVPLLPFVLISNQRVGLAAALVTTAGALFAVGYFVGWLADSERRWPSALRFLLIALGAASIGYLVGLAISPLGATAGP